MVHVSDDDRAVASEGIERVHVHRPGTRVPAPHPPFPGPAPRPAVHPLEQVK